MKPILIALALITLMAGGVLSLFVSSRPDGLEWAMEKTAGTTELEIKDSFTEGAALIQEKTVFMPDYNFTEEEGFAMGTSAAGIAGSVITFLFAGIAALIISLVKKKQKGSADTA